MLGRYVQVCTHVVVDNPQSSPNHGQYEASAAKAEVIKLQSTGAAGRPREYVDVGVSAFGRRALEHFNKCMLLLYIIILAYHLICIRINLLRMHMRRRS